MAPQVTVLERKAADCIVLGNSTTSAAIAYSLSKRQKKVIHIPDMGLEAHLPAHEALRPLTLPDLNLHICRLADESASYLRGLELQTSTPLVHRCRSLELGLPLSAAGAEASRSSIGSSGNVTQGTTMLHSAMALERMADVCKEAHVKLGSLAGGELVTSFSMLRPRGLKGLLQPDGGVINARSMHKALQALAARAGALGKDHLILRGWQDTGSVFRVHASSALQPDVVSVFEAEQLMLAPGDWVPDALKLFGLELDVQMRERQSVRCPTTSDISCVPLLRYWGGLPSMVEEREAQEAATRQQQLLQQQLEQQREGGGISGAAMHAPVKAAAGVVGSSSGNDEKEGEVGRRAGAGGVHWVLLPPGGGRPPRGKLSATSSSPQSQGPSRIVDSCWEWQSSQGAPSTLMDQGSQELPLRMERRQAGDLVKGLGTDDLTLLCDAEAQQQQQHHQQQQEQRPVVKPLLAVDLLTPDGLPILGWHPGFEPGRVLVACTTSGTFGCETPDNQPLPPSPSASTPSPVAHGGASRMADTALRNADVEARRHGDTLRGSSDGRWGQAGGDRMDRRREHGSSSSSSRSSSSSSSSSGGGVIRSSSQQSGQAQKMEGSASWGSSGTDGHQLSLTLAARACEALMGVSAETGGLSVSSSVMDLQRPCLRARGIPEIIGGDTLQGGLKPLQDGSLWEKLKMESMTEEELQAREERLVVARHLKAGGLGQWKQPTLQGRTHKQFF